MRDFNAFLDSTDEEKKKKALQTPSQQAAADVKKNTQPTRTANGKIDYNAILETAPKKPMLAPTSKPTQQPAKPQEQGFNLGGFLNNLGETIKSAIVKAVPQLNPENKPTIPTATTASTQPIQTPMQPIKQLDNAQSPTDAPSASLTPETMANPLMQNYQRKTVNIVDSVLKTLQNPVDPVTNTLLRAIPGVNSTMSTYKKGTEPLDVLKTYNSAIKAKLKSIQPNLETAYDWGSFLLPGKFQYFLAKQYESTPNEIDKIWKQEGKGFMDKLSNTGGVILQLGMYTFAPEIMKKVIPPTTLAQLEKILGVTYKENPVLFNLFGNAMGRNVDIAGEAAKGLVKSTTRSIGTLELINAAQQIKAGLDGGLTQKQVVDNILKSGTSKELLIGGAIFGISAEGWGVVRPSLFGYKKSGGQIFTPEQAKNQAEGTNIGEKDPKLAELINTAAIKAQTEGKNVKISTVAGFEGKLTKEIGFEKTKAIGEIIGVGTTPGGLKVQVELVDAPAPIQQLKGEAPTAKTPTAPTTALSTTTAEPQTMPEIMARYPIEKFSPSVISTGIQSGDKKFYIAEPTLIESLKPSDFNSPEMTKADIHLTAPGTSENLDGNIQRMLDQGYTFGGVMTKGQLPAPIQKEVQPSTPQGGVKTYYRGGGEPNIIKGKTAQDIVNYETQDLGNKINIEKGIDLSKIPSENIRWLTETKQAAKEYGDVTTQKGNYKIIARDNQGGILVDIKPSTPQGGVQTQTIAPTVKPMIKQTGKLVPDINHNQTEEDFKVGDRVNVVAESAGELSFDNSLKNAEVVGFKDGMVLLKSTIKGMTTYGDNGKTIALDPAILMNLSKPQQEAGIYYSELNRVKTYGKTPEEFIQKYFDTHGYPSQAGFENYLSTNRSSLPMSIKPAAVMEKLKEMYPNGIQNDSIVVSGDQSNKLLSNKGITTIKKSISETEQTIKELEKGIGEGGAKISKKRQMERLKSEKVILELQKKKLKAPEGMASAGAESIGAFENRLPETEVEKHNMKIAEQVKALIQKYASTVGEGYTSRGASGTYFPKTQNIRINGMNDLSVASHEIAHYLDFAYDISKPFREAGTRTKEETGIKKELTDIYLKYYPGSKATHKLEKRSVEGFATLLQKYVEMPKQITEEYPNLVNEFLTDGGKYYQPVIGDILKDLEKFIESYQALEPLDKIGTRVANDLLESDKKDFLNIFDKIRTFAEDEIYPIEKLDALAGTKWSGDSVSLWLRAYSNGGGIYANNILNGKSGYWTLSRNGEFEKVYDYNWKNLLDHLKKEKIDDSFGNYLVARDQYFEWQELDNLLVEVNKAQTLVNDSTPEQLAAKNEEGKTFIDLLKEAEDKYNAQKTYLDKNGFTRKEIEDAYVGNSERFEDESKMYDELVREDLTLLNNPNIGLVSDEQYAELIKKEGYASMKRQTFDDILGNEGDRLVGAKTTKASSLKQRTGGQQQIINPVLNGMVNHIEIVKKAMKQAIFNKIGKIAASNTLPTLFQVQKLRVFPDDQGKLVYPQEKDPNIIMARINGKRVPFLVDRTIKKTVESVLTYQAMNLFESLMVNVSRGFTLGTTGAYAPFALTNAVVDQWSAVMNTRNQYTPLLDIVKIIGTKLAKKDPEVSQFYNEWQILGGDRMTLFQSQMQTMNEAVKYVTQETTKLEKVQLLLDKGIDILSLPAKYSETMSRFTEYYKARKAGKNQLVALEEAGRVTAPFHHIGSWKVGDMPSAKYMVRSIPFGNAAFQAMSQAFRTAETQEGRHRIMFLMAALVASYLTSLWSVSQLGSEDQREQYKDLTPTDIATYLHFPAIGGNGLLRIKVSQELSTLGAIMVMVLSDNILQTKYTTEDYKDALTNWIPRQINIFSPIEMFFSWLPPAFKIPLELIANFKDYPRVKPLENQTMQNREPGLRFNEATSPLAKLIGEKFNISPIKTDFLIEGFLGRASRYITGKKGAYDVTSAGYREYFFSMGRRVQDFYDESTAINQRWNTLKTQYKGKTDLPSSVKEEISRVNQKRQMYENINDMLGELRKIDVKREKSKAVWYRNKIIQGFEQIDKMK